MGDEVRRSGRATKGQNPKNQDDGPHLATPKQRGKGGRSKSQKKATPSPPPEDDDDDDDAIIRCICGCVEEDKDDERVMVHCDNCKAWQHNECMEVAEDPADLPDEYFCELCKPEDHVELLAKVARGEKPWEERARQREREEEERKARRRKGGRKSKKGRVSEIKGGVLHEVKTSDIDINGTPASTPAKKVDPAPIKISEPLPSPKADLTPPTKDVAPPQPVIDDLPPEPMDIEPPIAATIPTPAPESAHATAHQTNTQTDVSANTPAISPGIGEVQPEAKVERGQKRKLPREISTGSKEAEQFEPSSKIRKISTSTKTKPPVTPTQRRKPSISVSASKQDTKEAVLQTELVENISELQSEPRRRIADALVKLFVEQTQQAEKQGAFKLPSGQAPDTFGLRLGLAVEYAIYLNFWGQSEVPSNTYADKFRTIMHNVKANTALRDRLLDGSLPPSQFSQMTTDEMASKELREKTVEMKKEAEKQHMLVQEDGPRIRRTHKGEELVGGDESQAAAVADQVYSQPIIRRREPNFETKGPKQASPEATSPHSPTAVELPENISVKTPSPTVMTQLVVDTKAPPRTPTATEKKSSTAFNIQNVWSSVSGPDGDNQRPRLPPQPTEPEQEPLQHPAAVVEADADIERLLNEEDPEDEEPYSPTDYTADPGSSVWRGKMMMAGVAGFTGVAKHVAGANLSSTFPWAQLIPSTLTIEGRIDIERASEYLCGLRWSQNTDVTVVAITPIDEPEARVHFDRLFKYFIERKRYGVIGKNAFSAVKDTYLVPLEAGMSKKPDFVELLEYCTIEDPSPERMLLLTFVVKSNNSPSAQATPRNNLDASSIASPITGSVQQTPTPFSSLSKAISHASPTKSYPGMVHALAPLASSPPQPSHTAFVPLQHSSHYTALPQQQPPTPMTPVQNFHSGPPTGMDAARKSLGDMATVPSVAQLLAEAPNTGVAEFDVIRDMLESAPASRNDFKLLKDMLAMKYHQSGGS